ncbi:MAG: SAM-dependent methyltransferase [Pseudomonadota bacterium]
MTPLAEVLARRIRGAGPLTVAEFMAECLTHPELGYYTNRDPLGAKGDFTTAPEISQMFGELVGLCLAQVWIDQGQPGSFVLAELGPGRGTLMADALRAIDRVDGFNEAAEIQLVETSPALRAVQAATLGGFAPKWQTRLEDLPDGPLFLVANEFFDTLPVRQFIRIGQAWAERVIGLKDGTLAFGRTAPAPLAELAHRIGDTSEGDLVETSSARTAAAREIARRIARFGGIALVVDYGDWRSQGDTLQALAGHAPENPLARPGQADLTTHVDFEPLAVAARDMGAQPTRLTPQGVFLERLGIAQRAETLAAGLSGQALDTHIAAHHRLTHPAEMGNLFKVMAFQPAESAPAPGFTS